MQLSDDAFTLFGLTRQFDINTATLTQQYQSLLKTHHPDTTAHLGADAILTATRWTVRINEAYQQLKTPLKRASLLCELAGEKLGMETHTQFSRSFLEAQMQWREQLSEARSSDALAPLEAQCQQALTAHIDEIAQQLQQGNALKAASLLRETAFLEKFLAQINDKFSQFENQ